MLIVSREFLVKNFDGDVKNKRVYVSPQKHNLIFHPGSVWEVRSKGGVFELYLKDRSPESKKGFKNDI